MFRYFARLSEKHDLPVYPVVIFSHKTPLRAEPGTYDVQFPGEIGVKFNYKVIQLNRLHWRDFLNRPNPVAAALMTRMNMSPEERPKVKLQCLQMLAELNYSPAKSEVAGVFIENYLKLTAAENNAYEREFAELAPDTKEKTMEMITSWHRQGLQIGLKEGRQEGLQQGLLEGKEDLVARLIRRRFGTVPTTVAKRLDKLTADQLNELGEALFDFSSLVDVKHWLAGH